ncbi:hypothetical protein ACFX2I_012304 [Malus domestica]
MLRQKKRNAMKLRKRVANIAAIGNKEKGGPCKLEQLPQALVTDILSRLSVKTVFNCRCVSKEWLSIISDPQFIHLHASRSPNGILIKDYPPHGRSRNAHFTHVDQFVGSDFRLEKISHVTNEHKVLQLNNSDEAEIYTIGTRAWRTIGNCPQEFCNYLPFNAFLHGALHSLRRECWGSDLIILTFNFDKEQFGSLSLPRLPENHFSNMLEYGVQESWTKIIVFESLHKYHRDLSWHSYEPLMFLNNGEIPLLFNNRDVVCYNQESKSFREISIQATTSPFLAIAYSPSSISLYDVAEGEEVERVGNRRNLKGVTALVPSAVSTFIYKEKNYVKHLVGGTGFSVCDQCLDASSEFFFNYFCMKVNRWSAKKLTLYSSANLLLLITKHMVKEATRETDLLL